MEKYTKIIKKKAVIALDEKHNIEYTNEKKTYLSGPAADLLHRYEEIDKSPEEIIQELDKLNGLISAYDEENEQLKIALGVQKRGK